MLNKDAVPSQFPWTHQPSSSSSGRAARSKERASKRQRLSDDADRQQLQSIGLDISLHNIAAAVEIYADSEVLSDPGCRDEGCQTDLLAAPILNSADTQTPETFNFLSVERFANDESALQFYTGLENYEIFQRILICLGPAAYRLNYLHGRTPNLDVSNQLFLTLIECRLYKVNFELSRIFGTSETEVYEIFITCIKFMSLQWHELNIWPD